jgi:hypothetical protein
MSISGNQVWEVRTTGNDANGGGFDSSVTSPGTDYSQQTGAQVAFDGVTITATIATTGATIIVTGHTVAAADVGNTFNVISGTGSWIAGWYTITAVNTGTGTWTLDRNVSSGAGSALVANMGGCLASLGKLFTVTQTANQGATGQLAYVKSTATYTFTTTVSINSSLSVAVIGYTTTRGDAGRITVTTSTNSTPLFQVGSNSRDLIYFANVTFSNTAGTPSACLNFASNQTVTFATFINCTFTGFTNAWDNATTTAWVIRLIFRDCSFFANTARAVYWQARGAGGNGHCSLHMYGCLVQTSGSGAGLEITTQTNGGDVFLLNTVFYSNGGHNVYNNCDRGVFIDPQITAVECAFVSATTDGVHQGSGGTHYSKVMAIFNSILSQSGGWGINFESLVNALGHVLYGYSNAYYSNSSGNLQNATQPPGMVSLTGDPFTSKSTGDFTLNNTSGAGAACRGAGWPTVIPE